MKSNNKIKAILFDLDGTLRHNLPTGGEVFTDFVISLGWPVTEEDRLRTAKWEHYYFASSPEIKADQEKFEGEEEDFWINFGQRRLAAMGCPPDLVQEFGPKVSSHMRENYKPDVWVPDEIHVVMPQLRASGYTLAVVSNRDQPIQEEIEELGLGDYFQFSLVAGEVQSWKPEPGIFEHALKIAGTSPEQTLYVGDNYYADVVGAQRAGLQPVLYDPKGIFPEPGCPIINSFDELLPILNNI